LRYENCNGRNIYIRPSGEHNLSLVDDLTQYGVAWMRRSGFAPALVVETSPDNFQAWLKHPRKLDKEVGTAAARALAVQFGADTGAADWRHYGRLGGFVNRKAKYFDAATGLYPYVRVIECSGAVYPAAARFLDEVVCRLDERHRTDRERRAVRGTNLPSRIGDAKSIEAFRGDSRYGGDGKRVDLAYAIYAFSQGQDESDVEAAIRSRDLSHKGNERRQRDYVERTIRKAFAACERSHRR
jgi:hypothetical protein